MVVRDERAVRVRNGAAAALRRRVPPGLGMVSRARTRECEVAEGSAGEFGNYERLRRQAQTSNVMVISLGDNHHLRLAFGAGVLASTLPGCRTSFRCSTSACRLIAPGGGDFPWGTAQRPTAELIAEDVLRNVPGVFPQDPSAPDVAAIILTHSHLDHYGLAHHAHPAIPVYGSDGTISMLEVGRVFFPDVALPADLRRLPLDEPLKVRRPHGDGHTRRPRRSGFASAARRG